MWWCWVPLRFDDFALHMILEEDMHGVRNTNFAVRVWPEGSGRQIEQLGWPLPDIQYEPGTRNPVHASIDLTTRDGKVSTLDIDPIMNIPLNVGCGYGMDPEWTHGLWKGESWVEGSCTTTTIPRSLGRAAYSIADHLAASPSTATKDGASSSTAASARTYRAASPTFEAAAVTRRL